MWSSYQILTREHFVKQADIDDNNIDEHEIELDKTVGADDSDDCESAAGALSVTDHGFIMVPPPGPQLPDDGELRVACGFCAVCLNGYKAGDTIMWSSNEDCPHVFHLACLRKWLRKKKSDQKCPCCRRYFVVPGPSDDTDRC